MLPRTRSIALQRHEHGIGGRKGVDRENPERRGTIDEDVLERVLREQRHEKVAQLVGTSWVVDQLDFDRDEILLAWDQGEGRELCRHEGLAQRGSTDQRVVHAALDGARRHAHAAACVALRVEVEKQRPALGCGHACRQVHSRRRFSHAALLIHDSDNACGARRGVAIACAGFGHLAPPLYPAAARDCNPPPERRATHRPALNGKSEPFFSRMDLCVVRCP
jgi:hypothetical protein